MPFSPYSLVMGTFPPMLAALSALLGKAAEHARAKGIEPAKLVHAQLAPDMFPLVMQVQIACDHALAAASRLTGREAPKFAMTETTLGELGARIEKTVGFVNSVPEADYAAAAGRAIAIEIAGAGMFFDMTGEEFLRDWALPHFYFHVVTAYDILRHEGVQIGKRDYLSHVGKYIRPTA